MTSISPLRARRGERGYMLLSMMLAVTLMAIAAAAIAPSITLQVRRDREEELIHRGVQYSRAVRRYFKKFGRYPTSLSDLENTNNLRFLRKRYKDPITNQDFKLLHYGEVQMMMGAGLAGGVAPGTPIGTGPAGTAQPAGGQFTLTSTTASTTAQLPPAVGQNAAPPEVAASNDSGDQSTTGTTSAQNPGQNNVSPFASGQGSGQTFGGGPILGVASTSKEETIREFNNKNHYNQWQFIYDPSTDRGGLLNTPAQPALQNAVPVQAVGTPAGGMGTGMTGVPGGAGAQNPGSNSPPPFGQPMQPPMNSQPQSQPPPQQP